MFLIFNRHNNILVVLVNAHDKKYNIKLPIIHFYIEILCRALQVYHALFILLYNIIKYLGR